MPEIDVTIDINQGGGAVDSVNGEVGDVVLTASDILTTQAETLQQVADGSIRRDASGKLTLEVSERPTVKLPDDKTEQMAYLSDMAEFATDTEAQKGEITTKAASPHAVKVAMQQFGLFGEPIQINAAEASPKFATLQDLQDAFPNGDNSRAYDVIVYGTTYARHGYNTLTGLWERQDGLNEITTQGFYVVNTSMDRVPTIETGYIDPPYWLLVYGENGSNYQNIVKMLDDSLGGVSINMWFRASNTSGGYTNFIDWQPMLLPPHSTGYPNVYYALEPDSSGIMKWMMANPVYSDVNVQTWTKGNDEGTQWTAEVSEHEPTYLVYGYVPTVILRKSIYDPSPRYGPDQVEASEPNEGKMTLTLETEARATPPAPGIVSVRLEKMRAAYFEA